MQYILGLQNAIYSFGKAPRAKNTSGKNEQEFQTNDIILH